MRTADFGPIFYSVVALGWDHFTAIMMGGMMTPTINSFNLHVSIA